MVNKKSHEHFSNGAENIMDKENLLEDIINISELQKYQDIFCEAQRIYIRNYNSKGVCVTKLSGNENDIESIFSQYGKFELNQKMQETVNELLYGDEDVEILWKDTVFENLKIVAIPNKIRKKKLGIVVMLVLYDVNEYESRHNLLNTKSIVNKISLDETQIAVKFLSSFSEIFIKFIYSKNANIEKLIEITEKENIIKNELIRKETITKVMQYLEKDKNIEQIVADIIIEISSYLKVSIITVEKISESDGNLQVIGEYYDELYSDKNQIVRELPFDLIENISGENDIVIDYNTDNEKYIDILKKYQLKSLIFLPIMSVKEPEIFMLFAQRNINQKWTIETLNFIYEIRKMLQSFLYKRISKNSLISSYAALKEILNNLGSGIYVIDKETKEILFCNDIIIKMVGKDLVGEHCNDNRTIGCKSCKRCCPLKSKSYFEERFNEKEERWYEVNYNDIIWVDGRKVSLCNITDVTDKKKYQKRIEFQANNDFLTGLYNRMKCEEDLQKSICTAINEKLCGEVFFIDLDDFKHINDGLGHQYGDLLLKMIATSLEQIPEIKNKCYRVGGDEFIIIIEPQVFHKRHSIISEIQRIFSSPWYLGENEYYCTMSMGIVKFPNSGKNVNDLVKKADIAMYDAKKSGKNRFKLYSNGEDENSYIKLDLEKNMRSAVAVGCREFEVYIQPIVDTSTEKCIGGEALVRWNSDKLGFLTPGEFIPLAEHLGLIAPIGEYVLRNTCILSKKWTDQGIDIRVNVNLSVVQLLANNIVDVIRNVINETGINPANLVLEVTESLAINDMTRMKKIIKKIKALGVKIALDDFGTGYSSLNYIKQMDLDIIKVDRTFIKDISEDEYARAFVKLIAELSRKLEVQVCVEGVEEKSQLDVLKSMDVQMIQGFYYGKPMKVEEFESKFITQSM